MERETEQQLIEAYLNRSGPTKCPPRQAWQTSAMTEAEERSLRRWKARTRSRNSGLAAPAYPAASRGRHRDRARKIVQPTR